MVEFSKSLYSQLGSRTPEAIAKSHRGEYDALNTDGSLGMTLAALYEMRILDLELAIAHAEEMRLVLALLASH